MYKPSDFIGASVAAERLGIDKSTLIRQAHAGDIEAWGKLEGPRGAFIFEKGYIERLAAARAARAVSTDA